MFISVRTGCDTMAPSMVMLMMLLRLEPSMYIMNMVIKTDMSGFCAMRHAI